MDSETKNCQNCDCKFTIEEEDFNFYEKIKVPPPTFCPRCRLQRRLAWSNLFDIYKRKCDLCLQERISMYPPEAPYKVFCPTCWWGDSWDPLDYGRDYDFSRPFFEQFDELIRAAPMLGLSNDLNVAFNCPYNNFAGWLKNCYMTFFADYNEDCFSSFYLNHSKSVLDSAIVFSSEFIYDSINTNNVYRGIGLWGKVTDSVDAYFLKDCANCQNCFASANLRNKKYYIFNKPYSKEDYFEEIKKYDLGSYKIYQMVKKLAEEHCNNFPPRPKYDDMSVNCSGEFVYQSKNCKECYEVIGVQDSKYVNMAYLPPIRDCYDYSMWGNNVSLIYECSGVGEFASNIYFSNLCGINVYNLEYCNHASASSNLFGCSGMNKGEYCIFNKKYSKDEYKELKERIIKHMNEMPYISKIKTRSGNYATYKYGEFLPPDLSIHSYNETTANNFFPMKKEEALALNYKWRDEEVKDYEVTKKHEDLPDHIKDAPDDIIYEIIQCSTCPRGFKIINDELAFLRKINLPLPRQCSFCRVNNKYNHWVKTLTLTTRICYKCNKEFQTHYTKSEAPKILCKECYKQEIY